MDVRILFSILDHIGDEYFSDLVAGKEAFCPGDVVWYDAGNIHSGPHVDGILRLPSSRPLAYAKEMPFFLDSFEWALANGYDYLVNLETDLAFVNHGFADFIVSTMADHDYMVSRLSLKTPRTSRWYPYLTLRRELPELLDILGIGHTNAGFNPGQVFSARFMKAVVDAPFYGRLRDFVERNQDPSCSFCLPEVLMPTLVEALGLPFVGYSDKASQYNRYRPYHAKRSVQQAVAEGVHLVHPIRRDPDHPARQYVRSLTLSARQRAQE